MNFQYNRLYLTTNQALKFTIDNQCNAFLVDEINFANYKSGRSFTYYGGLQNKTQFLLSPPYNGNWYWVLDTGGYSGTVNYKISII
jgi:hypothetical protein